jgi:hypothetical protein
MLGHEMAHGATMPPQLNDCSYLSRTAQMAPRSESDPQPPYRNRKPRWRAQRRREAKANGQPIPNRQEVWNVQVAALPAIPDVVATVFSGTLEL